jgi:hypothetical protein
MTEFDPVYVMDNIVKILNKIEKLSELSDELKKYLLWETHIVKEEEEKKEETKNIISMGPENKKRIFGEENV